MKTNTLTFILLFLLLGTYNIYAEETGSVDSTPQVAEVLNKNRTILMGFDVGGSGKWMETRPLVQWKLSYSYYYYPNNIQDKIKNGICLDFGFIYSKDLEKYGSYFDKDSALYFTTSVLYSLNSYGFSVNHNLLFNIGLTANFFLKKLKTIPVRIPGYSYSFAQAGLLMEIGYARFVTGLKHVLVFKVIFKILTEDITPKHSAHIYIYNFLYIGFTMSLLFNSN